MRKLRFLIIAIATAAVLTLGVMALATQLGGGGDPADDIIIKGGSLEIQCGTRHGTDCLGTPDNKGKYRAKKATWHVTNVVVRDATNANVVFLDRSFDPSKPPQIEIKYRELVTQRTTE